MASTQPKSLGYRWRLLLAAACWGYFLLVIASWVFLAWGDTLVAAHALALCPTLAGADSPGVVGPFRPALAAQNVAGLTGSSPGWPWSSDGLLYSLGTLTTLST